MQNLSIITDNAHCDIKLLIHFHLQNDLSKKNVKMCNFKRENSFIYVSTLLYF